MNRKETEKQAKTRIANALAAEIKVWQVEGIPNEIIAVKVYAALVQSKYEIEQFKVIIEHYSNVLGSEIKEIIKK